MIAAAAGIAAVVVAALAAVTWWIVRHPIEAFVASTRRKLRASGLRRNTLDGSVYWTGGAGERPLVLLHGVNDQAGTWSLVVPALAPTYRLIIPDLAGHGESEPGSGPLALDLILDKLHAILVRETNGPVTLAGNSMGGWVAMLYAFAHPERVERLLLEDASGMAWPLPPVPLVPKTRDEVIAAIRAVQGPAAKTPALAVNAMLRRTNTPMARMLATGVSPEHLVDLRLPSLKVPTTIVWGKDEGVLPVAYAEMLHQRIPGSRLHVIEGAAHIPHRQQPEKFVSCLTSTS